MELEKLVVFAQNYETIYSHDPSTGYTLAVNQFMDMTPKEFKETMLGGKPIPKYPEGTQYHD